MRNLVAFAAATSLVAGIGCSSRPVPQGPPPPPFYEPTVNLANVRLNGVGLTGGSLDVLLDIHNPNDYALRASRITYRVLVGDVELGSGSLNTDFPIATRDSASTQLPVSFSYLGAGKAGRGLLNTGAVNYRVLGHITVGTPYGGYRFPYDRSGSFKTLSASLPR